MESAVEHALRDEGRALCADVRDERAGQLLLGPPVPAATSAANMTLSASRRRPNTTTHASVSAASARCPALIAASASTTECLYPTASCATRLDERASVHPGASAAGAHRAIWLDDHEEGVRSCSLHASLFIPRVGRARGLADRRPRLVVRARAPPAAAGLAVQRLRLRGPSRRRAAPGVRAVNARHNPHQGSRPVRRTAGPVHTTAFAGAYFAFYR